MEINSIVMVGAGRVAFHLGMALSEAGYDVCQVFSRTEKAARDLSERLNCFFTTSPENLVKTADLYIVSVADAALAEMLPRVAACSPDALFVHTAGSVPMRAWDGLAKRFGVLYPMQTFSRQRRVDFREVPFFVEAAFPDDAERLKKVARALGSPAFDATSEQRKYLHIAAVFACNFTNYMYDVSSRLLSRHGLPFEAMLPLIDETARKIHELAPAEAQTGPACRNDRNVMAEHLEMLADMPSWAEVYRLVSRNIIENTQSKNEQL